MADEKLHGSRALGFNQGSPRGQQSAPPAKRAPQPLFPDRPPTIAWNRRSAEHVTACSFRRFDDGSYQLEGVAYFTAGDSDGGECD
ncbi:MAG: hypothetical protein V4764_02895 [Burkholderia sp.]